MSGGFAVSFFCIALHVAWKKRAPHGAGLTHWDIVSFEAEFSARSDGLGGPASRFALIRNPPTRPGRAAKEAPQALVSRRFPRLIARLLQGNVKGLTDSQP